MTMTTDERLAANLTEYQAALEDVDNLTADVGVGVPVDVSPEHREKLRRDLYTKYRDAWQALAKEKVDTLTANVEITRANAFRPQVKGESHTAVMMSFRDALDRIEGETDPRALRERLATAYELSDHIQAKAILFKGYQLGADFGGTEIVTDYLKRYPGDIENWTKFQDAAEAYNRLEVMGPGYMPSAPSGVNEEPPSLSAVS